MNVWQWVQVETAAARLNVPRRFVLRFIHARPACGLMIDGVAFVWLNDLVERMKRLKMPLRWFTFRDRFSPAWMEWAAETEDGCSVAAGRPGVPKD